MKSEKELQELARRDASRFKKLLLGREPGLRLKKQAIYVLGRISEEDPLTAEKFVEPLLSCLEDADEEVRAGAVAALAALGDSMPGILKPGVEKFLGLLEDDNLNIRRNAAYALALIGEEDPGLVSEAVRKLVGYLRSGEDIIRANAACSLALFARGNPGTVLPYAEDFIRALKDENEVVRTNAIYILGHIGKEDVELVRGVIPELIGFLRGDAMLKENAAYALALIGIKNPGLIKEAIPTLLELLRDSREEIRATSACALGASCNPEALKSLRELLSDHSLVNIYHPEGRVFVATTVSEMARQAAEKARKLFLHPKDRGESPPWRAGKPGKP